MAQVDFRLRINGRVEADVAQSVAKAAVALRDAGEAAGLESVLDLGGLMIVPPVPIADPVAEPEPESPKASSRRR